jgi:endonuclease I
MKARSTLFLFLWLLIPAAHAQAPAGYYDPAIGKTGDILRAALRDITINGHVKITYTSSSFDVWDAYTYTDVRPVPNNSIVWDMYSDNPGGTPPYTFTIYTNQCGTASTEGDCYSREHCMPNSWWGGLDNAANPQYSDLHHLFPADQFVNLKKSNNIVAQTSSPTWTSLNGSKLGPCTFPGYTGTIFEPINEYKGDFARAYLYLATRYMNNLSTWVTTYTEYDSKYIINSTGGNYKQWYIDMLLAWNNSDPVSQKEIDRNNNIYYNTPQHNRNPYIDHPEYVTAVWTPGVVKTEPTNHPTAFTSSAGSPTYNAINFNWTDATGVVLPDGYLIKGSTVSLAAITDPADGTAITDGGLNKNVIYGVKSSIFTGLTASTNYYFKTYSYTNSGTDINYKVDGTIQTTNLATTTGSSTLLTGDIAIIEVITTDPDRISFITFKQISAGTIINFTDNGYTDANTVRTGEGYLTYTAPSTIAAGSVISWYYGMSVAGTGWNTGTPGSFLLSTSGDQVFAYQGTWGSGHTLLFGVNVGNSSWLTTGIASSNTSYLPATLTNNINALNIVADNCNYNLITTGTANALASLIGNPANWTSNSSNMATPSWNYSLTTATTISQNATVQNLLIANGETLAIPPGKQLTVNGILTNNAGNSSLLISTDATGSGSLMHYTNFVGATINRYITGASNAWHLLSSPVSQTIAGSGFVPDGSNYDLYCWDEPTHVWVNFKNTTVEPTWSTANGEDFLAGRGYLVAYEAENPTNPFQGLLNNGQIDFDLSYTGTGALPGSNLAGNPYPSAIDWKAATGWSRNSLAVSGTGKDMWIWNETTGNYGVFNSTGTIGTNGVTQYIAVGQAFFVQAASPGTLSMDNSVRVHQNPAFLKSKDELTDILRLKISNTANSYTDEVVVDFTDKSQPGSSPKWFSMYADSPGLYLLKGNEMCSIDFPGATSRQTESLCLTPGVSASYTLTAELLNTFSVATTIILKDLETGYSQDLVKTPQYSFTAKPGDDPNRFLLDFGGTGGKSEKEGTRSLKVFIRDEVIYFEMPPGARIDGELSIYNLLGQNILNRKLTGSSPQTIQLSNVHGCILVRMVMVDGTYSGKVVLK